ncbi:MAG: rhomboid family intramembrane serine protease [Kiritimatiellae bacterium]|nr:rhomboid family intramembrane serine protease [Kiritimatiellia bacterium]
MVRLRQFLWRIAGRVPLPAFGPAALTIASICVGIFAVQEVSARVQFAPGYGFDTCLTYIFGLHWPLLAKGFVWQPVTYSFLHGSWVHLALNMFSLLCFGSAVEQLVGRGRFWRLFLVSGAIGGLGWMLFDWVEPMLWAHVQTWPGAIWSRLAQRWAEHQAIGRYGICVGASAGVFGLIGAFAALCPRRELLILLLFVPLRMRARQVALLLMCITVGELIAGRGQVAYAAHLFGGLGGYLLARRWLRGALRWRE